MQNELSMNIEDQPQGRLFVSLDGRIWRSYPVVRMVILRMDRAPRYHILSRTPFFRLVLRKKKVLRRCSLQASLYFG